MTIEKKPYKDYTLFELIELEEELGSERQVCKFLECPRSSFQNHIAELKAEAFKDRPQKAAVRIDPLKTGVKRFIFTSAQDSTNVFKPFLINLLAYADYWDADLRIGGFTYNKKLFEDHSKYHAYFVEEVRPYLCNDRLEIGPNLVFLGEMNTLPTAVSPLSGLEGYTQNRSGIFPHAKVQMQSIGTIKGQRPKTLVTTGCVTLPNYVPKKAGIKAEFHHIQGAVFVELMPNGDPFMRHLMADHNGNFQDLDWRMDDGEISFGNPVEAITHGDIHWENMDRTTAGLVWFNEKDTLVDVLKPRFQIFHDTLDFDNRSHHRIKDSHHLFKMHVRGDDSIEENMIGIGDFLLQTSRDFSHSVVIESNHDRHYLNWLKTADFRLDPANAQLFLWATLECYKAIEAGNDKFSIFEHTVREYGPELLKDKVEFVREDGSFVICETPDRAGIENGLHGHLGVNGSKGSVKALTKIGPRTNSAHTHSPTIIDGAYCAGTYSKLDLEWNRGPSSWAHACIVTYPNGKRTIVQFCNGMWRAPLD